MDQPPSPSKKERKRDSDRDKKRDGKEKSRHHHNGDKHRHRSPPAAAKKEGHPGNDAREAVEKIEAKPAAPRWQPVDVSLKKDETGASLLPEETSPTVFQSVYLFKASDGKPPMGALCITNFRVYYRESSQTPISGANTAAFAAMASVAKSNKHGLGVKILTKDGRKLIFMIRDRQVRREIHGLIFKRVFPQTPSYFAFEFKYMARGGPADEGWQLFDEKAEYGRIGLPSDLYRLTEINRGFAACQSYPEQLFVPTSFSDKELAAVAKFRSSHRMPVVTWLHPCSGASLTRCSQPLVGVLNHKCKEDATYVAALIAAAPKSNGKLVMLDPRPSANASANKLRGGGVEDLGAYKGCTLEFGDIENIHVVRTNLTKVFKLCRRTAKGGAELPPTFTVQFYETGWPQQVLSIMRQAQRIVDLMTEGVPVLVHCSDGWDRTCQTIALAELCMDHYYRTLRGLAVLIEKEWIAYGHKFAQRHGLDKNMGKEKDEQRAPIFFQFLDCLYQLVQQYPTAFEFTPAFIIALADHAHSGIFGTFLANNVAERANMKLPTATASLWTYALHCSDTQPGFLNSSFQPTTDTLKMSSTLADIRLFAPYFTRWSATGVNAPGFNYLLRTAPS